MKFIKGGIHYIEKFTCNLKIDGFNYVDEFSLEEFNKVGVNHLDTGNVYLVPTTHSWFSTKNCD